MRYCKKKNAVRRVAREIEILRLAAPLLTEDAPTDLPTLDLHSHDAHIHDTQTRVAQIVDAPSHDALTDNMPADYVPTHIPDDDGNTEIASASLLTDESNDTESGGQDEANSAPTKKVSGRLSGWPGPSSVSSRASEPDIAPYVARLRIFTRACFIRIVFRRQRKQIRLSMHLTN
jgi:hypothetical protein